MKGHDERAVSTPAFDPPRSDLHPRSGFRLLATLSLPVVTALSCAQGEALVASDGAGFVLVPADAGDASTQDQACRDGQKLCDGQCVAPSPAVGCSLTTCKPCEAPPPGYASLCTNSRCDVECQNPPCSSTGGSAGTGTDGALPAEPMDGGLEPDASGGATSTGGGNNVGGATGSGGMAGAGGTPGSGGTANACPFAGNTDCTRCACGQCASALSACTASSDQQRNEDCLRIIECAAANACSGITCYCGNQSLIDCGFQQPAGACVDVIRQAAGTNNAVEILELLENQDHAVGLAATVGGCAQSACAPACGLD